MAPRPRWTSTSRTGLARSPPLTGGPAYPAQLAQWTNVFGVTDASATKESVKPPGAVNTWARTSYKDCSGLVVVEANSGPSNVVHDLTPEGLWQDVVRFFGLAQRGTAVGGPCGGTGGASGTATGPCQVTPMPSPDVGLPCGVMEVCPDGTDYRVRCDGTSGACMCFMKGVPTAAMPTLSCNPFIPSVALAACGFPDGKI